MYDLATPIGRQQAVAYDFGVNDVKAGFAFSPSLLARHPDLKAAYERGYKDETERQKLEKKN